MDPFPHLSDAEWLVMKRLWEQHPRTAQELVAELASKQQANGAWINPKGRWLEGDPNLVTGYVLLALSYCRPGAK